jgi:hypothetical protein
LPFEVLILHLRWLEKQPMLQRERQIVRHMQVFEHLL